MNRYTHFNPLVSFLSPIRSVCSLKRPAAIFFAAVFTALAALLFSCGPRVTPADIPLRDLDGGQTGTGGAADGLFSDDGETEDRQMIPQPTQDAAGNISAPQPDSATHDDAKFVVLSSPDGLFTVNGTVVNVARYAGVEEAPLDFSRSDQYLTKVRFKQPGFYGLTVREADRPEFYSVFVSPLPTVHTDAAGTDFDWYLTQFNTGTTSNCGPAAVAMGIAWSTGKHFPVSAVREAVGWQGDGSTSFEELLKVIKDQGIPAAISPIRDAQSIKDVINAGGIAVVLFRTEGIGTSADPAGDLFGKYYDDSVGHYIVIKGYSLDDEYFVIYDPIPSDWSYNSFRYGDDLSMIGRNRYYPAAELLGSLRRADMIAVPRLN